MPPRRQWCLWHCKISRGVRQGDKGVSSSKNYLCVQKLPSDELGINVDEENLTAPRFADDVSHATSIVNDIEAQDYLTNTRIVKTVRSGIANAQRKN